MLFMKLNKFLSIGEFTNPELGKREGEGSVLMHALYKLGNHELHSRGLVQLYLNRFVLSA